MATDVISIWNRAISQSGSRASIASETETGREGDLCRLWYPLVRDGVLKAAAWPSATKSNYLGLKEERDLNLDWVLGDPSPTFKYAYIAPSDMLAPQYLATFERFTRQMIGEQICIMTNAEQAILTYTSRQEVVNLWDVGLEMAVTYALAAHLALPLTGKRTTAGDLFNFAEKYILEAREAVSNEADYRFDSLAPWHQARGYESLPNTARFFWPVEDFNALRP